MFNNPVSNKINKNHNKMEFITCFERLGRLITIDTGNADKDVRGF